MARKGMVVDVVIHAPHAHNDDRNYHVHMLLTMREIGPDGFANKVREWNTTTEFNRWMERWSELGAEHLERAGFHKEAERFRVGHLSRPERARLAHERGDFEHFEQLLNEPLIHRGPEASGMEKKGHVTRISDINREIEERNKMRGTPREIREAYALSSDPHVFAQTLEQKNMLLARITKDDARNYATEFAITDKYVPQYKEGEYVIATEQGSVYRLTRMTTGDSYKGIRGFTKPLNQQDYPSLEAALGEMMKRSLIPNVDRDAVIAELMRPSSVSSGIDLSKYKSRTALPDGANAPHVRGDSAQVWWAYNSTRSPEAFEESLQGRSLHLARVTAEDARDSHTQRWAAMRQGRYHPILKEGEYVAVNERGQAYRLNRNSVSHNDREVKAFLSTLDQTPMPSLRQVQNAVHEKRMQEIDPASRGFTATDLRTRSAGSLRRTRRVAERVAGQTLDFVATAFETLFTRTITPEERQLAAVLDHERQVAIERRERQHSNYDRAR
jgi:MobA/MobL family